jgi:hypothetical protein
MQRRARFSLMVGFLLVLPFVIMEYSTRTGAPGGYFHVAWFIVMWISAGVFFYVLAPIVQVIRTGNLAVLSPVPTLLKVALLAFIAWNWIVMVTDQWPCFLGATGC